MACDRLSLLAGEIITKEAAAKAAEIEITPVGGRIYR